MAASSSAAAAAAPASATAAPAAASAAAAKTPDVVVYESSVASTVAVKKHQDAVKNLLKAKKVNYVAVDVSTDSKAKDFMHAHSKAADKNTLPQIFVRGEYRGTYDDMNDANETESFAKWIQ